MSLQVLPVENVASDRLGVATTLISSYHEKDAYFRAIYPSMTLDELIQNASLRLGRNLLDPDCWHLKIVDASTNEIFSYARWEMPAHVMEKLEKEHPKTKPEGQELEKFMEDWKKGTEDGSPKGYVGVEGVGEGMSWGREAFPVSVAHCTLDMLATLPSHQGRGAAAAHLNWGTKLADEEGLAIFLEATPAGKRLYENWDFEVVRQVTHDLTKGGAGEGTFTHSFMVRYPKK